MNWINWQKFIHWIIHIILYVGTGLVVVYVASLIGSSTKLVATRLSSCNFFSLTYRTLGLLWIWVCVSLSLSPSFTDIEAICDKMSTGNCFLIFIVPLFISFLVSCFPLHSFCILQATAKQTKLTPKKPMSRTTQTRTGAKTKLGTNCNQQGTHREIKTTKAATNDVLMMVVGWSFS